MGMAKVLAKAAKVKGVKSLNKLAKPKTLKKVVKPLKKACKSCCDACCG